MKNDISHNIIVNYYTLTRDESQKAYIEMVKHIYMCTLLRTHYNIPKQQIQETSQRSRNCFIFSFILYTTDSIFILYKTRGTSKWEIKRSQVRQYTVFERTVCVLYVPLECCLLKILPEKLWGFTYCAEDINPIEKGTKFVIIICGKKFSLLSSCNSCFVHFINFCYISIILCGCYRKSDNLISHSNGKVQQC